MNCKKCGKKYHYCTSCSPEMCCDEGYCSDGCWKESEEHERVKNNFLNFYKSLNEEQKGYFRFFAYELDPNYEYQSEVWVKENYLNGRKEG